jgi:hypothetical protein
MQKTLMTLLLVTPLIAGLSGCVVKLNSNNDEGYSYSTDSEDRTYNNRKQIAKLPLGSSFIDIQGKLGVSDFSETYPDNSDTVRILYYRTQRKHKDGLTTKDECTYLQFVNGELVATGNGEDFSRG